MVMTGGWFIIVLLTFYNIDIVTIVKGILNNEHTLIDLIDIHVKTHKECFKEPSIFCEICEEFA